MSEEPSSADPTADESAAAVSPDDDLTGDAAAADASRESAADTRTGTGTDTTTANTTADDAAMSGTQPPPGSEHTRDRSTADVAQFFSRLTRESTLAQDQLAFDYVRDDGLIVADETAYVGLVRVEPVNWQARADSQQQSVIDAFAGALLGIEYPFQLLALPRQFDLEDHLAALERTRETVRDQVDAGRRPPPPPLLVAGRDVYQQWLDQTLDAKAIKIREFYAAIRVDAEHLETAIEPSRSRQRLGRLGRVLRPLVGLVSGLKSRLGRLSPGSSRDGNLESRAIEEVRQRQHEIASALGQTGAGTEVITERSTSLDVLYRYYNNEISELSSYSHDEYRQLLPELRD